MRQLSTLAKAVPGVVQCVGPDVALTGICADSRHVASGSLFVAISGVAVDGHSYIREALARGAAAIAGERAPSAGLGSALPGATYLQVVDSRAAWGWLSAAWHGFPSRDMALVGVTGTDGKTTTVNLVYSILQAAGHNAGMISTVAARVGDHIADTGLHTTTPDPPAVQSLLAQMARQGSTHAVLEVTSHGLAQNRIAGCDFDVAVVTNITHEHLDYHGTFESYRQAKGKLFESLATSYRKGATPKVLVLNADDGSHAYLDRYNADSKLRYGLSKQTDVTARDIQYESRCTRFTLLTPLGGATAVLNLAGEYNLANALAAAAATTALGIAPEVVARGLESAAPVPGRMERIEEGQPYVAIVDFAHTPFALTQALDAVRGAVSERGRVIAVFGCAGLRDRAKRGMMGRIAGRLADVLVVTAEDPRTENLQSISEQIAAAAVQQGKKEGRDLWSIDDRSQAILFACRLARQGDVVIAFGKGHEQSMCFGVTEYPWDDREALRRAIHGRTLDTLPTAAR